MASVTDCHMCGEPDAPFRFTDYTSRNAVDEIHLCRECWAKRDGEPEEERDEAYERAAARARSNDFERTGGRDWT